MSKRDEIKMADCIESMIKKKIFRPPYYEIRREGQDLLPPERGLERHRLQLCVNNNNFPKKVRDIDNPDALILNKKDKIVEVILEYEVNTNPKNIAGNFITPFLTDQYESNFTDDKNDIYVLSPKHSIILVIVWFPKKRDSTPRGQAPLNKGEIIAKSLMGIKNKISPHSLIRDGAIIIDDDLKQIVEKTQSELLRMKSKKK